MIIRKVGIYEVIFSDSVIEILQSYKQIGKKQNEAGGILIGQVNVNKIYILRATIPNKFDKATRYSFERDKNIAQCIVEYEFYNSSQKSIYIGEWHTHPENYPTPSGTDLKMIKDQFSKNKLNEPFLLLLIIGLKDFYLGIYDGKKLL